MYAYFTLTSLARIVELRSTEGESLTANKTVNWICCFSWNFNWLPAVTGGRNDGHVVGLSKNVGLTWDLETPCLFDLDTLAIEFFECR